MTYRRLALLLAVVGWAALGIVLRQLKLPAEPGHAARARVGEMGTAPSDDAFNVSQTSNATSAQHPGAQAGELRAAFSQILHLHRETKRADRKMQKDCLEQRTYYSASRKFHYDKARLWTLAYPGDAEGIVIPIVLDSSSDPDDRELAIYSLGILAEEGYTRATGVLVEIAAAGHDPWSHRATEALVRADSDGVHRSIYWNKARQGNYAAVQALGDWVDTSSVRVLEEIQTRARSLSDGVLAGFARESLEHIGILSSPNWVQALEPMLVVRGSKFERSFAWALRVAARRSMPGLATLLRVRLDHSENEFRQSMCAYFDISPESDLSGVKPYVDGFTHGFLFTQADAFFDDVLIAFARLGGQLTELERGRLQALGYLGDPKDRLAELLAEHR